MEPLIEAFQWVAVIVSGILLRAAIGIAVLAAVVAVVVPVMLAFEGGRRALRRLRGLEDVLGFEWRRTLRYAPAHLWITERGPALRLGVDALAARLLAGVGQVHVPSVGTRLGPGDAMARFTVGGREVALPAPVAGVITDTNFRLEDSPELAVRAPYASGWLVEMRPDTAAHRSFPRASQALEWFKGEAGRVAFALEHAHGYAAADGGVPIVPPHELRLTDDDVERMATAFLGATVTTAAH